MKPTMAVPLSMDVILFFEFELWCFAQKRRSVPRGLKSGDSAAERDHRARPLSVGEVERRRARARRNGRALDRCWHARLRPLVRARDTDRLAGKRRPTLRRRPPPAYARAARRARWR